MTSKLICHKVGDYESWERVHFKECEECTASECIIRVLINHIKFLEERVKKLEEKVSENASRKD